MPIVLSTIRQNIFKFSDFEHLVPLVLSMKISYNIIDKTIVLNLSDDVNLLFSQQTPTYVHTHRTNELSTIILLQPAAAAAVDARTRFFLLLSVSYMLAFRASLSPNTEKVLHGCAGEVGTGWTRRPERTLY